MTAFTSKGFLCSLLSDKDVGSEERSISVNYNTYVYTFICFCLFLFFFNFFSLNKKTKNSRKTPSVLAAHNQLKKNIYLFLVGSHLYPLNTPYILSLLAYLLNYICI